MQLYPAIDMKNGQCVRLRQGAFKDITIYSDAPEKVAAHWQEKGHPSCIWWTWTAPGRLFCQ